LIGATFHSTAACRKAKSSSLAAASSPGKWPQVPTARRGYKFKFSVAFVVYMILRTA
jgi:hypothetical protein